MKYLGYVFSAKKTLPNEDKIEVVRNWAIPNDVTDGTKSVSRNCIVLP